ncbi:MAG: alpha-keto acid decarboxylase family protein [Anaerolineales bacterium]|nr:alpha-keto acid decarboxylase family protein [Chloroflexota bacterium]MBL6983326.1 alpha-keto acid decarboxylase family protein [Anaerolineales bacterium]
MTNTVIQESMPTTKTQDLGNYLFTTLRDVGVQHCFGIPGDYVLTLFKTLEETPGIQAVVGTHEPCSAFSADAYARSKGLGVLLLTYGVGGFNVMNGVACAYAESSPLLVISGGPPVQDQNGQNPFAPQAHHVVKLGTSQLDAFEQITDLTLRIDDPATAAERIRKAIDHTMRVKRPVYLEIPTDLMSAQILIPEQITQQALRNSKSLDKAVELFRNRITDSRTPVIIAGVEVGRFKLQDQIRQLGSELKIPIVTSVLGKGLFDETEVGIYGMYGGIISQSAEVRQMVESADLVLMIGMKITDVNCGAFTANLRQDQILIAKSDWIGDGYLQFSEIIPFDQFINKLVNHLPFADQPRDLPVAVGMSYPYQNTQMDRYLDVLNEFLTAEHVVVADTGDSCYGSLLLTTQRENGYLAPTFYNSMGFAVPAALGVQLADPRCRPVVLVGDGAFQMTGVEFSNLVAWKSNAVVILFNNNGFGMQRIFVDGTFNDIARWDYTKIVELVGGGQSRRVSAPEEFRSTLKEVEQISDVPTIIEVDVEQGDISTGLNLIGDAFLREKRGICPMSVDETPCDYQNHCAFCRAVIWK